MDTKKVSRRRALGVQGETYAAGWCARHGLKVLERNWRSPAGELDLVALDTTNGDLVGIEVKTRSGRGFGLPAEAVGSEKLWRLHRLVREFADQAAESAAGRIIKPTTRVDVVGIMWPPHADEPQSVEYYRAVITP